MEAEPADPPGAVPWRYVILDPDGNRQVGYRWARPYASARDIAEELLAVVAYQQWKASTAERVKTVVVQVVRPAHGGWPAEYGEAHGITLIDEVASGDLGEVA